MLFPDPRQQFCDAVDLVIGDAGEDIAEIGFWIDGTEFAGLDQGIDCGGTLASSV